MPRCFVTSLADGTRVSKADGRIEACGTLDELSAHMGGVCAMLRRLIEERGAVHAEELCHVLGLLRDVQSQLFGIGAQMVGAGENVDERLEQGEEQLARETARLQKMGIRFRGFVLPGGSPIACAVHVNRAVCRRAEREVVKLGYRAAVEYLNALSKYLFHLALFLNHIEGVDEIIL